MTHKSVRNNGRWGDTIDPIDLDMRLDYLIWNVPVYDKCMLYTPYSFHFRDSIRGSNVCFLCSRKSRKVYAHHVHPFGEATLENGVALCKLCHEWIHYMLRKIRGYPMIRFEK